MTELTVPDSLTGVRLQDYLERRWPGVDRAFLRDLIVEGRVTVNRMTVRRSTRLTGGDLVEVELPVSADRLPRRRRAPREPGLPAALAEDPRALIVDKPAGATTVPDRSGSDPGVVGRIAAARPKLDLRAAHRLDRDASGCLALAKGLDGARWLDRAFRDGTVGKEYLALVEGEVARRAIEVRRALGPDRRRPGKVTVVAEGSKRSRSAHTSIEVVERFRGFTLVRARPTTGRGHQIRVHLRSIGHPIVGDVDYGARGPLRLSTFKPRYKLRRGVVERPLLTRMFLHAKRLVLPADDVHPELVAEAPLPADLELALGKLRRFAAIHSQEGTSCG